MTATNAQTGPAWRASARKQQRQAQVARRGHRKFYTGPLLILLFIVVELLLVSRLAGQATAQDPNWFPFASVLFLTEYLVWPFRDLRPEPELKTTGVIEFATLVALEAYLIAFLVLIFLVQVTRISAWFVRRGRRNARAQPALTVVEPPASTQTTETQRAA